jgi:hypothetical protein
MKPFDYYSNVDVKYEGSENYTTYFVYNKGECIFQGSGKEYKKAMNGFPKNAVIQKVYDRDGHRRLLSEYNKKLNMLKEEFKADLFNEFDVTNNPKRDLCFEKACDIGHSSGYSEIYNVFSDLVDLIT